MKEAAFQRRVTDMADRFGWKWWHVPAPMVAGSGEDGPRWRPYAHAAGLADLILTHHDPPRLVFMELKGDGGKLSDRQQEFLQAVKAVAATTKGFHNHHPEARASVFTPDGEEIVLAETPAYNSTGHTVAVYAFWPQDEPQIEQLLRSKVLT